MSFGKRLARHRRAAGQTQADLARAIGGSSVDDLATRGQQPETVLRHDERTRCGLEGDRVVPAGRQARRSNGRRRGALSRIPIAE